MRQRAPDLLLYPISDVGEALARVPHREVVDPPPQHWIDQAYHPLNRLRPVSSKCPPELPQHRWYDVELGRVMRPHRSAQTAEVAEVNPQKAEVLTTFQVDSAALFIIDFDLQFGELLP